MASQSALSVIADVDASEHGHFTRVRQRRAGREVDEHFGGRLIKPEDRDVLAGGDPQGRDPERPKPAIVLGDAGELEDRCVTCRAGRLTSSTMRLDSS